MATDDGARVTAGALVVEAGGTAGIVLALVVAGASDAGLAPLAAAAAVAAAVALGRPVCRGQFNPAVTVGTWVDGLMPLREMFAYLLAQGSGGLVGAAVAVPTIDLVTGPATAENSIPWERSDVIAAVLGEACVTAVLVLTHLVLAGRGGGGAGPLRPLDLAVPIGLVVLVGTVLVAPLSGGAFNPVAAVGLAVSGKIPWVLAGLLVPLHLSAGALAAAVAPLWSRGGGAAAGRLPAPRAVPRASGAGARSTTPRS